MALTVELPEQIEQELRQLWGERELPRKAAGAGDRSLSRRPDLSRQVGRAARHELCRAGGVPQHSRRALQLPSRRSPTGHCAESTLRLYYPALNRKFPPRTVYGETSLLRNSLPFSLMQAI